MSLDAYAHYQHFEDDGICDEDYVVDSSDDVISRAVENFIISLKEEDEQSCTRGDRFSRACRARGCAQPAARVVSTACGHAVCAAHAYDAACPLCRVSPTAFAPLLEHPLSPRACAFCHYPAPASRMLLTACGHSACRACAFRIREGADGEVVVTCDHCPDSDRRGVAGPE